MLYFFIILGSLFLAIYTTSNCKYVRDGLQGETGWSSTFVLGGAKLATVIYISLIWLVLYFLGYVHFPFNWDFWLMLLATTVLNVCFEILRFRAYGLTHMGLIAPFGGVSPILTILTSWLIIREVPSLKGVIGIILVSLSIYFLYLKGGWTLSQILKPFKSIWKNKGTRYGFLASIPPALAIVFDKKAVMAADPITFSLFSAFAIGFSAWLIDCSFQGKNCFFNQINKRNIFRFLKIGIFYTIALLSFNATFLFAIVPYVSALRRVAIVFEVILARLFLKERRYFTKRIIAAGGVVAGAVLIGLSL